MKHPEDSGLEITLYERPLTELVRQADKALDDDDRFNALEELLTYIKSHWCDDSFAPDTDDREFPFAENE